VFCSSLARPHDWMYTSFYSKNTCVGYFDLKNTMLTFLIEEPKKTDTILHLWMTAGQITNIIMFFFRVLATCLTKPGTSQSSHPWKPQISQIRNTFVIRVFHQILLGWTNHRIMGWPWHVARDWRRRIREIFWLASLNENISWKI
jgi:hypothetical protein